MTRCLALAVALTFSGTSAAACKDFAAAIESAEKEIALEFAGGIGDDSAPRSAARAGRVGNHLATIQANLFVMDRAKCPLPAEPVDVMGGPFAEAAVKCATARAQQNATAAAEACNSFNWKRPPK